MIATTYNNKIELFPNKECKAINDFALKNLKYAGNIAYCTDEKLLELDFHYVIDEDCNENQHLGEVEYIDGQYYRFAVDNPIIPPMPEPSINIDSRKIKSEIGELFAPRGFDFQNNYPMIMDNLKDAPIPMYRKNMENLKTYSLGYKLTGLITDAEFMAFRQIFIDNGFDLNDY
jgi:hypothetical protein